MSLRRFALFVALIVSGAAATARAQESDIIRGKVTGPDSLPLENVKVTAMSLATNQSISRNTGKDGRYTIIFPNGGGDFMVSFAAIGFQPTQKEVKREQDEAILIADQALGKNPTMLNAIRVTAQRQQVDRNDDTRNGGGVGSGDRGIDLTQVGIGSQGDLAAMAASLPGVTYIPGADGGPAGFSILGLGADQNLTTLNGLNFAGSDLPRDAVTTGRVSTNPFNPTQGGFSGGQLSLRTSPGTNFVTQSVHFTMDSKALQFTDQAGQQLGTQYNNVTASGAWRGPIALDKAYYSTSLQGSRQMSDLQTLINTDAFALQSIGISADSARRLDSLLNAFGIPSTLGTIPTSKVNDAFSGIAQIDWTPSAGHNFHLHRQRQLPPGRGRRHQQRPPDPHQRRPDAGVQHRPSGPPLQLLRQRLPRRDQFGVAVEPTTPPIRISRCPTRTFASRRPLPTARPARSRRSPSAATRPIRPIPRR